MRENKYKDLVKFLYEIGCLKRIPRSGWFVLGVTNPETVAEHIFRTAIIGYILAILENADPAKVVLMCLVHDLPETRILDLHHLAQKYIPKNSVDIEGRVMKDMVNTLPSRVSQKMYEYYREYVESNSLEAKIVRDADKLDMLLQAREYKAQGFSVDDFIKYGINNLSTTSAKALANEIMNVQIFEWWK